MFSRNLAVLSLLMAMLLWASGYIAMKFALQSYDPMVMMLGRMLIASIVFALFFRRTFSFDYQPGDWRALLIMVLAEPCFYFVFEAYALQNTSAQQAGVVLAMMPLLVSLGAWAWLGETLHRNSLLGFGVAIIGAVWLSVSGEVSEHAPDPLWGNFLEFCAVLCAVVYILSVKRLSARYSPWLLTALQSFAGALFFLPILALPQVTLPQSLDESHYGAIVAIIYLGVVVNIGAYGLYNLAVSKVSASQSSAFINLIPVFTLVLAWLILGERLNAQQLLASVLVMAGLLLSQWTPRAPAAPVASVS